MGAPVEQRMAKLIRAATEAGQPPKRVVVARNGDIVLVLAGEPADDYDTAYLRR